MDVSSSHVYIADDEAANRALLAALLARDGMTAVHMFEDGRSLLDAMLVREPDLVLLDYRMPVLNGLEVLRLMNRSRQPDAYVPVIVLTADHGSDIRRVMLRAGANDFITKPFDADEILLRVRNLLETRRLHVALSARNSELKDQVDVARDDLSHREQDWLAAASALGGLETGATMEDTAQAVCDALGRVTDLSSVLVVALDAGRQAVPLAHYGASDVRIGVNRALPRTLIDHWRDRVGSDTWIGPWEPGFGSLMVRLPHEQPSAMAIIPLRTSKGLLGALTAATTRADGVAYLAGRRAVLESFAAIASALLAPGIQERQEHGLVRGHVEAILTEQSFVPVFQPIIDLASGVVVGYEALTRFSDGTRPDRRFADAAAVGLGIELEAATLTAAISEARHLPPASWLSLNVSPALLMETSRLRAALVAVTRELVLEVTEHVAIEDYGRFRGSVAALGDGVRIAVDDAGAGFASFRHILELRPWFVKLDQSLVRDIDRDPVRQALAAGIVHFAASSGCELIAEGIEREAELRTVEHLGIDLGQGFLIGSPERGGVLRRTSVVAAPPDVPYAVGVAS